MDDAFPANPDPILPPSQRGLLELVAYLHLRFGDPRRAIAYLKVLSRIMPSDPRIARSLALAELRTGSPAKAAGTAARAVAMNDTPGGTEASRLLLGLASAAGNAGDTGPCEEFLRMKTTPTAA